MLSKGSFTRLDIIDIKFDDYIGECYKAPPWPHLLYLNIQLKQPSKKKS